MNQTSETPTVARYRVRRAIGQRKWEPELLTIEDTRTGKTIDEMVYPIKFPDAAARDCAVLNAIARTEA